MQATFESYLHRAKMINESDYAKKYISNAQQVGDILGIGVDQLGGNIPGFIFDLRINDAPCVLMFGWANGALGYDLQTSDGNPYDKNELDSSYPSPMGEMTDENASPQEQADYIRVIVDGFGGEI